MISQGTDLSQRRNYLMIVEKDVQIPMRDGTLLYADTFRPEGGEGESSEEEIFLPHTHPNEQFNYLLKGKLKAVVNGEEQLVTPGTLIHIPANAVHATVGLITEPMQADEIIRNDRADAVLLGRQMLRDPYWALHAAQSLKQPVPVPVQYLRAL